MARSINFVWNYINELSTRSIKERGQFLSAYDLHPYTKGAGKELGLHSQTLQCVAGEYVTRRKQFKKAKLNWRKSVGVRRSLGWIPVNTGQAKWKNGQVFHNGIYFSVWDSFGLDQYTFRSASFNEDARGRWYFNVVVSVEAETSEGTGSIGIDLGCKESATDSNVLLSGCTSPSKQPKAFFPSGSWMLLNPQEYQPNIIFGALMICPEQSSESECHPGHTVLALIEENRGHGCTDYIGQGVIQPVSSATQWRMESEGELVGVFRWQGETLKLTDSDGKEMYFVAMSEDNLDSKLNESCEASLNDHKAEKIKQSGI